MFEDTDVYDYFPLQNGSLPPSSAIMTKLSKVPSKHKNIFQIDDYYSWFIDNKNKARLENLKEYYQSIPDVNRVPIIQYMIERLLTEYSDTFLWLRPLNELWNIKRKEILRFDDDWNLVKACTVLGKDLKYVDSFDALAMQVPEDLIVCTLRENNENFVSTAHLMSPADWSAPWVINKSFAEIHKNVKKADGSKVIKNSSTMVKGILRMRTPVQRIGAISFRSTKVLNLHPKKHEKNQWTWGDQQKVFMRFERQVVIPFPEINSFLFTIKNYWNDLLDPRRIVQAIQALENIQSNAYYRDFIREEGENLLDFLKKKKEQYENLGL